MRSRHHFSGNLNRWLGNRRWKIFILGLPVVVTGLILAIVAGIVLSRGKSELQRRYDRIVKYALATGRFEMARVASLRELNDSTNERDRAQWIYYLALAVNGLGHQRDAVALIAAAAPLEPRGAGCMDAHLALAQSLLSDTNLTDDAVRLAKLNPTNAVAQTLHQAESHLLSALAIAPEAPDVHELLARFYIHTRQPAKAREQLMKIYVARPETALLLAVCADLENDEPSVMQWAGRALITFENNLIKSAPQYNPADRLGLLQAVMIEQKYTASTGTTAKPRPVVLNAVPQDSPPMWLGIVGLLASNGKYGAALATLEHQMAASPDPTYKPAIAQICATLAQSIAPPPKGDSVLRLRLIQEGLTNAPDNLMLQLLLVQAAHDTDTSGLQAKMLLDQRVAKSTGETGAWWHFVLWSDARFRGDLVTGRQELQIAYQMAPQLPQIKNDLAMLDLYSTNRLDWEHGLSIIQSLYVLYPYDPGIRDTRGQILARLGRNREALEDLEFSVTKLQNPTNTRRVLAKVYAALGIVHQDTSSDQIVQVRTLMNDGNYPLAVKTLEQAMQVNSNSTYATAMGDACVAWLENSRPASPTAQLQLIQKGLTYDPQNQKLQARLLVAVRATDDSGAAAKKLLDQLVAGSIGDSAAEWHLFLGRDARVRGDLTVARRELQAAYELAPQRMEIQIELATVLAAGNQEDLGRALELIQLVVDAFPDNAEFRNTRGRILARLGRNADAVDDLYFAVDRLSDASASKESRLILANVYDALGKPQLAEQQRRLAGITR